MSRLLAAALACVAAPWLAACADSAPGPREGERTVLDATGEPVVLPREVRRIVATVPGLSDTVAALGAKALLVGVSERDAAGEGPGAPAKIPTWPSISAERVAALAPDLVLVDRTLSSHDLPGLRARFRGTFAADSSSLDGLVRTFQRLGEALGHEDAAARLVAELARARREVRVPGRPRVLLLSWADPVMALGPGSLLSDMVESIGAENVASDLGRPSGEIPAERVREKAPDWILLTGGTFPERLRRDWAAVPAVRDGHVVDASADDLVRAGPGTAKALARLAQLLTPSGKAPR